MLPEFRITSVAVVATIISIPILALGQSNVHQRIEKMRPLKMMVGEWVLSSTMIPPNRPQITESGSMSCKSIYDSTYVECDVSLTNTSGRKRGYREFITYNPDSSRYEVLYLYTGTAMRVLEFGQVTGGVLTTRAMLKQAGGKVETIDGIMKIISQDEMYYESRSSETRGEVDYTCRFIRRK